MRHNIKGNILKSISTETLINVYHISDGDAIEIVDEIKFFVDWLSVCLYFMFLYIIY